MGTRGRCNLRERVIKVLATGFGSGYAPFAPGTAGTLVGVPVFIFFSSFSPAVYLLLMAALLGAAVYLSREAEIIFARHDPPCIVIDEITGLLVSMFLVSPTPAHIFFGFIFFRFFDIVKPFPVRRLQERLPGGYGVVGDDVMAGLYGNMALQAAIKFLGL